MGLNLVAAVAAVVSVSSGCGAFHSGGAGVAAEAGADLSNSGGKMSLRIVPAGKDPALPDPGVDPKDPQPVDEAVTQGNEISLKNVVQLSADHPVFFAWHEAALGAKIVEAHFRHRAQNPENQIAGVEDRETVSYDPGTQRWFIPITKVLPHEASAVDSAVSRLVTIDLLLEDRTKVEFTILFRARGPLPRIPAVALDLDGLSENPASFAEQARGGLVVRRESYTNPSARPLNVWVHTDPQELHVISNFEYPIYQARPDAPAAFVRNERVSSYGTYAMTQLVVRKGEEPLNRRSLGQKTWEKVELGAFESIVLEWLATPSSSLCHIPAPTQIVFNWMECNEQCQKVKSVLGSFIRIPPEVAGEVLHIGAYPIPVTMVAARFSGSFTREVRISDLYVAEPDATAENSASSLVLAQTPVEFAATRGNPTAGMPAGCQGIF
ncbi:MAG: hypothetical protein ACXWPM_13315 [Bdellovibrionota bacterium]